MTALASVIVEPAAYRPSDDEPFMNERQLAYFKGKLMDWKDDILRESKGTVVNLKAETENHPDLVDRASSESDRALELRTRDRQRKLISKIDEALRRIEDGSYGYCEETGEPISLGRLEARPTATLSVEARGAARAPRTGAPGRLTGRSGRQGGLDIRAGEVVAFEEQRRVKLAGQGIGETVTQVEPGHRALAVTGFGRTGDRSGCCGGGLDLDIQLTQQTVKIFHARRSAEALQSDCGVPVADRRQPDSAGPQQHLPKVRAVLFVKEHRHQRGCVHDHHFGRPSSS